jgi:hypothetical protein
MVANRAKAKILMTDPSPRDARYHGLKDVGQFTLKGASVELVERVDAGFWSVRTCTKHGERKRG